MKGIDGKLGEMKIHLKLDSKLAKHIIYQLNPRYNKKVKVEIYRMLEYGIIALVAESKWISLMVIQDIKTCGIIIYVDFWNLNDSFLHDPFPTPFTYLVLKNVG
jgi:hypothetical protein